MHGMQLRILLLRLWENVMKTDYKYECPSEKGYSRLRLKSKDKKAILKYRKNNLFQKQVWWLSGDKSHVRVEHYVSFLGKFLGILFFPVEGLMNGFFNRELYRDYKRLLFQKKYGSFSSDVIFLDRHKHVAQKLGIV